MNVAQPPSSAVCAALEHLHACSHLEHKEYVHLKPPHRLFINIPADINAYHHIQDVTMETQLYTDPKKIAFTSVY